jgi:hypothetical protein
MSLRAVATESVPCLCGKGLITLNVTVRSEGPVEYSIEQISECVVCRSTDLVAARARSAPLPDPLPAVAGRGRNNHGTQGA